MKQWLNIDKPYDQINHMHCHCLYDRILISRIHNGVHLKEGSHSNCILLILCFLCSCLATHKLECGMDWIGMRWINGMDWEGDRLMEWNGVRRINGMDWIGVRWINGPMEWSEMD